MALYAFDGTNDDDRNTGSTAAAVAADTNVFRFYSAYTGYAQSLGIKTEYVPGVGTRFGLPGKIVGGAWGVGWLDRIKDRKSTRLNSSHVSISYAVFCLKKKKITNKTTR